MKAIHVVKLLAITGMGCLASSCSTFSGNKLPKATPPAASATKKVALTYSLKAGSKQMNGSRQNVDSANAQKYAKQITPFLQKSNRFSSITSGKGGDVHVDLDMYNHGNHGAAFASGFITGYTLGIIPGFATDQYKLTATARTSTGKSRQYVLDDSATTVIWLPLIVAMPFNGPTATIPKVHDNMYQNLFQRMEQDGLLPKPKN